MFKILIVDDDQDSVLVAKAFLKKRHCNDKIHVSKNGKSAYDWFLLGKTDLIIMDICMPVMNGNDAITAIRTLEFKNNLIRTPIIVLTACAFSKDREESISAGCDDFLTKPVSSKDFLKCVAKYKALWERRNNINYCSWETTGLCLNDRPKLRLEEECPVKCMLYENENSIPTKKEQRKRFVAFSGKSKQKPDQRFG
jgi:two-component system, cell cycle response regulator DivK